MIAEIDFAWWADKIKAIFGLLELLIADPKNLIIVALWFVGYLAKNTKRIPDEDIPIVLVVFSILFCIPAFWGEWQALPRAMVYAGTALLCHRLYRHWFRKKIGDEDENTVTVSSEGRADQKVKASSPATITVEKTTHESQAEQKDK